MTVSNQNPNTKRSHPMKVSLTPATFEKLKVVAETLGMAPSAVAAMAVSEYAAAKFITFNAAEKTSQQAIEAMVPHMAQMFQALAEKEEPSC
jgi:hypothetical protein